MKKFMISVALVAICSLAVQAADPKKNGNSNGNSNKGVVPTTNIQPIKTLSPGNGNVHPTISTVNPMFSKSLKFDKVQNLTPKYTAKDYNLKFGKKCDFGWCFKGKCHDHWTCCCYIVDYGCNCFWCPCTLVWYYYCVPDDCWYPVTYCPYTVYVW